MFADVKSEPYELSETVKEELESVADEVSWLEQFPKRWIIVILCFSAFLLCNMDRVSFKLLLLQEHMEHIEHCHHSIYDIIVFYDSID